MEHRIRLYTREGCHLCQEAEGILEKLKDEFKLAIELVDIDRDDGLLARYGNVIPVIAIDDRISLSAPLDEPRLRQALENPEDYY
ncbi:MAG: glutaredoxin family protein [Dehalococcoidia bacterium]